MGTRPIDAKKTEIAEINEEIAELKSLQLELDAQISGLNSTIRVPSSADADDTLSSLEEIFYTTEDIGERQVKVLAEFKKRGFTVHDDELPELREQVGKGVEATFEFLEKIAAEQEEEDKQKMEELHRCNKDKREVMTKLGKLNFEKIMLEDSDSDEDGKGKKDVTLCMICNEDLYNTSLGEPINVHADRPNQSPHTCHKACLWRYIKQPTIYYQEGEVDNIVFGTEDSYAIRKDPEIHNSQCPYCRVDINKTEVVQAPTKETPDVPTEETPDVPTEEPTEETPDYLALAKEYRNIRHNENWSGIPTQDQIMLFSQDPQCRLPSITYTQAAEFLNNAEVREFWASINATDPRRRLASKRLLQRLAGAA